MPPAVRGLLRGSALAVVDMSSRPRNGSSAHTLDLLPAASVPTERPKGKSVLLKRCALVLENLRTQKALRLRQVSYRQVSAAHVLHLHMLMSLSQFTGEHRSRKRW